MNTAVSHDGSIETGECMARNNWNGARCHRLIQVVGFIEFDDEDQTIGRCERHASDGFVVTGNADSR